MNFTSSLTSLIPKERSWSLSYKGPKGLKSLKALLAVLFWQLENWLCCHTNCCGLQDVNKHLSICMYMVGQMNLWTLQIILPEATMGKT